MTRTVTLVITAMLLSALVCGCDPQPGVLVDDPPLPPKSPDDDPPPMVRRYGPPPSRPTPGAADHVSTASAVVASAALADTPRAGTTVQPLDAAWTPGNPRRWTHIILHHSATDSGNAREFDRLHRRQNQWDEMGYHFVIDNGAGGADGRVEIGSRWRKQKHGAHCRVDPNDANYWNEHGIGICLVGDFTDAPPSAQQLAATARLVAYLMDACDVRPENVLGHGQVPGTNTECPGRSFPYAALKARVARLQR